MALAALNVIGYVSVRAWECLALFALSGYSAHCYCKNVSLAVVALFVANFVFGCGRVENFEEMRVVLLRSKNLLKGKTLDRKCGDFS